MRELLDERVHSSRKSGDELPPELHKREQRLEKIREAKQALEDEQAEKDKQQGRHPGDGKISPTATTRRRWWKKAVS